MHTNTDTRELDPPGAVQKVIWYSRRNVESLVVTVLPSSWIYQGLPKALPEALVQTFFTAVPCALLCSQTGGEKTLPAGLRYGSESSLLEERAKHHSFSS